MFGAVYECYMSVFEKSHQRLAESIQKQKWFQFYGTLNILSLLKIIFYLIINFYIKY